MILSALPAFRKATAALAVAALLASTFGLALTAQIANAAVVKEPTDLNNVPSNKDDCKDNGWMNYGFSNQGLCIAWVNGQGGDEDDGDDDGNGTSTPDTSTVTIVKYIDGEHATSGSAGGASFGMHAAWSDPNGIGSGSGDFALGASTYEAVTSPLTTDEADYSTHEIMDGSTVGEECMEQGGPDFKLVGYSVGDTLDDAEEATPSMTAPSFTNLDDDMFVIVWNEKCDNDNQGGGNATSTVKVTIDKYVDGMQATAASASSTTFNFIADYDAMVSGNHIAGSDPYNIGPVGNNSPNPYEAVTLNFEPGADYATHEVVNSTVGNSCQDGKPYALLGYTTGSTLAQAQAGTPTTTAPSFDNLQQNKFVIVWNDRCDNNGQGGGGDNSATSTVTIHKYVDGVQATAQNASSTSFAMEANWSDPNGIGTGSGSFALNPAGSYMAVTAPLTTGEADYATHEVMDGSIVGASCLSEGGPNYRLVGYTMGDSLAQAQAATPTTTAPSLMDIANNKHIIVWNEFCDDSGDGDGNGTSTAPTLTLVKHATGGNGTFTFNLTGATATSSSLTTSGGAATSSPITLNVGSTTISEVQSSAWITMNISCVYDNQSVGVQLSSTSEEVSVGMGDEVTCTFTNAATSTGTTTDAALHVDSIDAQKTTAIANDSYIDGWRYVFHITDPNSEENLQMRFSDWIGQNASNTIPVANNMRISSAQASSTSPITLTGSNIYSTPPMIMVTDLNPAMPGRQVEVLVEVKIPVGTQNDTYTTNYGVQSLP